MKRYGPAVAFVTCALCILPSVATRAEAPLLRVSLSTMDLPGAGITIHCLEGAVPSPLAPPTRYTYRNNAGGVVMEAYDPRELWISSQHVGRWQDRFANSLVIAEMKTMYPDNVIRTRMTKDEYEATMQGQGPVEWDLDNLQRWAEKYVGTASLSPAKRLPQSYQTEELVAFHLPDSKLAYAFRMAAGPGEQGSKQEVAPRWFFVLFDVDTLSGKDESVMMIQERFLKTITPFKPGAAPAVSGTRDQASKRFQDPRQAGLTNRSPEFVASRQRVIDSIKNMQGWWYVETKNYVIMSNMESRDRDFIRRLQSDIELLRPVFERVLPPEGPVKDVSVIRVFATAAEYEQYVPPGIRWSAGVWAASREELVLRAPGRGEGANEIELTLGNVYHEAFHQYVYYASGGRQLPPWFNEGHAAMFQSAVIRGRRIEIGEYQEMAQLFESLASVDSLDFRGLLSLSLEQFYQVQDPTGEQRRRNYARAWGLIYYLRKCAPLGRDNPYARILPAYWEANLAGKGESVAMEQAFARVNLEKLEKDATEFWRSSSRRSLAARSDKW